MIFLRLVGFIIILFLIYFLYSNPKNKEWSSQEAVTQSTDVTHEDSTEIGTEIRVVGRSQGITYQRSVLIDTVNAIRSAYVEETK